MDKLNPRHIFIDTNIIIGAYLLDKKEDAECLRYLFSICRRGVKLFLSSLTIAQFISVSQKKKVYDRKTLTDRISTLSTKCTIIDFLHTDIKKALENENDDIEDNIQYIIGKKKNCQYFITNNKKDYAFFNILAVNSKECRNKIITY